MNFHPDDLEDNAQIRRFYNRFPLSADSILEPPEANAVTAGEKEIAQLIEQRSNNHYNGGRRTKALQRKEMKALYFKGVKSSDFNKVMREIGL